MTAPADPAAVTRADIGRESLIIERVETLALRAPLGRRFTGSASSMDNRCTIVTRLTTAEGVTSEIYAGDTDVEQAVIVGIIHDELAPRLIGRSASDPEGAWLAMEPSTNDILRDRGLALQAIACLDTDRDCVARSKAILTPQSRQMRVSLARQFFGRTAPTRTFEVFLIPPGPIPADIVPIGHRSVWGN